MLYKTATTTEKSQAKYVITEILQKSITTSNKDLVIKLNNDSKEKRFDTFKI